MTRKTEPCDNRASNREAEGRNMSRHNYIAGGVPNLVTSRRPIYLVHSNRLKINPYNWKPGKVITITEWPFGNTTLEINNSPNPTQRIEVGTDRDIDDLIADWEQVE